MVVRMASYIAFVVGLLPVGTIGFPLTVYVDDSDAKKLMVVGMAAEPWSRVHRWLIEYEAVPSSRSKEDISVHRIMAVSAPGEFYHMSAHFSRWHTWPVDPFCQEYFISHGKTCHRWPFNRIYSEGKVKRGDSLGGTIEYDFLLTIVPRWPLTAYKRPVDSESGTPLIPLEAIRSPDFRLLPKGDHIAGEDCDVFDREGLDRIWVATKKGVCVMRRDIRDFRSRRLAQRILTDKVAEVAKGIWLPTSFRSQFFSARRGPNDDTIEREYRILILRCVLNDAVPSSVFTPSHRAGSLRFDSASQFTQVSPGGEDLLSDIVSFMVQYAELPTRPAVESHEFGRFLRAGVAGLCLSVFLLLVRMGNGRQKTE